jgi:transcription antitermination protein NusB
LALQALYQIEMTGDASGAAVDFFLNHFEGKSKAKEFARRLVSGVVSQGMEIDGLIERCTENWRLVRLAKVDLVILRVATYELVFCPDIPLQVSLDEAIEIGKRYGDMESAAFINGVLDQIAHLNADKSDGS